MNTNVGQYRQFISHHTGSYETQPLCPINVYPEIILDQRLDTDTLDGFLCATNQSLDIVAVSHKIQYNELMILASSYLYPTTYT